MLPSRREGSGGSIRRPASSRRPEDEGTSSSSVTAPWERVTQEGVLVHISLPSSSSSSTVVSSRREGSKWGSEHASGAGEHSRHREPEFGRNVRRSERCAPASMRRAVYAAMVQALPLDQSGRRHRVRDISALFYRRNPAGAHRLGPWLAREFEALLGEDHVEFMMQLVLSLIDKVDMESDLFVTHLLPFLGERAAHFVHELVMFAKSPFDIIAYDGKVRYNWPANYPVPGAPSGALDPSSRHASTRPCSSSGATAEAGTRGLGHSEGVAGQENATTDGSSGQLVAGTNENSGQAVSGSLSPETRPGLSPTLRQRIFDETSEPADDSCFIVEQEILPITVHDSDSDLNFSDFDGDPAVERGEGLNPAASLQNDQPSTGNNSTRPQGCASEEHDISPAASVQQGSGSSSPGSGYVSPRERNPIVASLDSEPGGNGCQARRCKWNNIRPESSIVDCGSRVTSKEPVGPEQDDADLEFRPAADQRKLAQNTLMHGQEQVEFSPELNWNEPTTANRDPLHRSSSCPRSYADDESHVPFVSSRWDTIDDLANADEINPFVCDDDEMNFNISQNEREASRMVSESHKGKSKLIPSDLTHKGGSPHQSDLKRKHDGSSEGHKKSRRGKERRKRLEKSVAGERASAKRESRKQTRKHRHHKRRQRSSSSESPFPRKRKHSRIVLVSPPKPDTEKFLATESDSAPQREKDDRVLLLSPPTSDSCPSTPPKTRDGVKLMSPPRSDSDGSSPLLPHKTTDKVVTVSSPDCDIEESPPSLQEDGQEDGHMVKLLSPLSGSLHLTQNASLHRSPGKNNDVETAQKDVTISGEASMHELSPPRRKKHGRLLVSPAPGARRLGSVVSVPRKECSSTSSNVNRPISETACLVDTGSMQGEARFEGGSTQRATPGHRDTRSKAGGVKSLGRPDPLTSNSSSGNLNTKDYLLRLEANALEEEIRKRKKQLLKSALRKERIELLHKNLHGGRGLGSAVTSSSGNLQDELVQLDEKLLSEKRCLLKVLKKMEEEKAENSD